VLLQISVDAVRRLLATTVLAVRRTLADVVAHERWRLTHQTRALISHYKRRGDPIPIHLRI
jgi:hypothetical protein